MTVILITGANKGIGFESARQLRASGHEVYLGARDLARGTAAADAIGARFVQLDVTDDESVTRALGVIADEQDRLDVLVHNAGILADGALDGPTALRAFDTNAVGIVRVTEAALPLLRRSDAATVVTISSSLGSFWVVTNPERPESTLSVPLYSASKAAATMLTLQYAKAHPDIRFTSVEPGYTATDLNAHIGGGRSVAETARVVARFATEAVDGPNGALRDEHGILAW